MSKPVILTGLRANNDLHIGNYLGALLPMVDMAKKHAGKHQINLFVPDLHSFTTPIDHGSLQAAIMQNLRMFVAAGLPLDNPDVHIYRQSYIPAHSELTWILDCFTGMGEMERMTQYKDKSRKLYKENSEYFNQKLQGEHDTAALEQMKAKVSERIVSRVSVGLFNYPALMAADILLYNSTYVPVGEDQTQHLEFARDIAGRMNKKFGDLFIMPKAVKQQHEFFGKDQGLRIKDLVDPTKKMSKSDESSKGVIFMTDKPDDAAGKILRATTDNLQSIKYNPENQPGISNLLQIYTLLLGQPIEDINKSAWFGSPEYHQIKNVVADRVATFLREFQAKLAKVDGKAILDKLATSEKLMNKQANETLLKVQKAVGLRA
jgi:tryptophanyl-tRNA synthetase